MFERQTKMPPMTKMAESNLSLFKNFRRIGALTSLASSWLLLKAGVAVSASNDILGLTGEEINRDFGIGFILAGLRIISKLPIIDEGLSMLKPKYIEPFDIIPEVIDLKLNNFKYGSLIIMVAEMANVGIKISLPFLIDRLIHLYANQELLMATLEAKDPVTLVSIAIASLGLLDVGLRVGGLLQKVK